MPTTPDLVTLIRSTKAKIAELQGVLDAARAELDGTATSKALKSRATAKATQLMPVRSADKRRRRRRAGSTAWAQAIVAETGPLHVDEIVTKIKERFHRPVDKQTLVGNLARLAKRHDTFYRQAPNTFGLIDQPKEKAG